MKATLTFDLPEEADEHTLAVNGGKFHSALWQTDQWLRGKLKYGHEYSDADTALQAARNMLHAELSAAGVSF